MICCYIINIKIVIPLNFVQLSRGDMAFSYITEVLCVDLSLNEDGQVRDAGELDIGRVLPVLLLAQDFCRSLGLLVLQGTQQEPSSFSHPLKI